MDKNTFNQRYPVGTPVFVTLPDKSQRPGVIGSEARHIGGSCVAARVKYVDGQKPEGGTFPIGKISARKLLTQSTS